MLPSAENAISGAGFGNPALGGDGEWAAVLVWYLRYGAFGMVDEEREWVERGDWIQIEGH